MNREEKAIEVLQTKLNELKSISNSTKFNEWKVGTMEVLSHLYGEQHSSYTSLKKITPFQYSDITQEAKDKATNLLTTLIDNLKNFGFPKQVELSSNGVSVSVNQAQHNNQKQSTNVQISIDVLFKELEAEIGRVGTRELKAILDGEGTPEEKKKSFFEKIRSFGSDVASNILANVLVNPKVYEQIGGMF